MAFGKLKSIFGEEIIENASEDEYYSISAEESLKKGTDGGNKMILIEPRAYSESQQIADHLKSRNSVVVNFKRVTSDQAKRIIDFLSGTLLLLVETCKRLVGVYIYALLKMLMCKVK